MRLRLLNHTPVFSNTLNRARRARMWARAFSKPIRTEIPVHLNCFGQKAQHFSFSRFLVHKFRYLDLSKLPFLHTGCDFRARFRTYLLSSSPEPVPCHRNRDSFGLKVVHIGNLCFLNTGTLQRKCSSTWYVRWILQPIFLKILALGFIRLCCELHLHGCNLTFENNPPEKSV